MTLPTVSYLEGLRNTRQALGDGTLGGRVRSATPWEPKAPGGTGQVIEATPSKSTAAQWLWLRRTTAQTIASGGGYVTWPVEVTDPARRGFASWGAVPTDTITLPADGLYAFTLAYASSYTGWTAPQIEIGGTVYDFDSGAADPTATGGDWLAETMFIPADAGAQVKVKLNQTSGGGQSIAGASLRVACWAVYEPTATQTTVVQGLYNAAGNELHELSVTDLSVVRSSSTGGALPRHGVGGDTTVIWAGYVPDVRVYEHSVVDFTVVQSAAAPSNQVYGTGGKADIVWVAVENLGTIYEFSETDLTQVRNSGSLGSNEVTDVGGATNVLWHVNNATDLMKERNPADFTLIRQAASAPSNFAYGAGGSASQPWMSDDTTGLVYELSDIDLTVVQSAAGGGAGGGGIGGIDEEDLL